MLCLLAMLILGTFTPPAPPVLLLADTTGHSFEQALVQRELIASLFLDPTVTLHTDSSPARALLQGSAWGQLATQDLACAHNLLRDLEPHQALALAERALGRAKQSARMTGNVIPLTRALALLGACYGATGATQLSEATFLHLLAIAPEHGLDPSVTSTGSRAALAGARRRLTEASRRPLKVRAYPADAALFVDGIFVGFGDADLDLTADFAHYVVAVAPGHTSLSQVVPALWEYEARTLALTLLPDPAAQPSSGVRSFIEAARQKHAFVDVMSPVVESLRLRSIWVLGYEAGRLRLTHFDLIKGRREEVHAHAAVTELRDGQMAAAGLISAVTSLDP